MADGAPPRDPGNAATPPQPEPPPLSSIRVKGPGAKGLNKMAILGAAGGGVAIVLVLASGAHSGNTSRKPAETKLMMSDPARPEMAKGTIRQLPADYTEIPGARPTAEPALPPQLGPPLPGDVAAFAQAHPELRSYSGGDDDWRPQPTAYAPVDPIDPRAGEAAEAERSGLFFAMRERPEPTATGGTGQRTLSPTPATMTAFAPSGPDRLSSGASPERALFPGAVIPASLLTELNSQSAGPVIAQVTQATFDSATGRTLLIPQGARLIGDYKPSMRYGQDRVAIIWSRLVMPDGAEIALAEAALDPSGAAGVSGDVDNHWSDVFGAAALGTLINVGVATTEEPQLSYGGLGVTTRDPVDAAVADGIQRSASSVTNRVVDRGLAIAPTIRVASGTKLSVIVTQRVHF